MSFCDREAVAQVLRGKTVALVGSGPGALENQRGIVDSHDVVCRVNNNKLFPGTGYRTDVHYSYYGNAIRKSHLELKREGVNLVMCKCPNAQFIESEWHRKNGKMNGVDFRWIYEKRADWWFCPTYVPTVEDFMAKFELLGGHVPTTGFSALLDILSFEPQHVFLTGFDFFTSGIHNANERWRPNNPADPIGHKPERERAWLKDNIDRLPITLDAAATKALMSNEKPSRRRVVAA